MTSKFLSFIILVIMLSACDNIPDSVVDSAEDPVNIVSINIPDQIVYRDSPERLNIKITLENTASLIQVWSKVRLADGSLTIAPQVLLRDNGDIENNNDLQANDNTYSGFIEMTDENPRGDYIIEIYVSTNNAASKKISVSKVEYVTFVENIAPVISDLSAPDTIVVEDPRSVFRMTVKASDENGPQDIKSVYFVTTRLDGSSNGAQLFLDDTGNFEEYGDETAGDGTYSIVIQVTNENQKGEYTFDFRAQDRSNSLSNIISHKIVLE